MDLRNFIENYAETPSADCWDNIAQQLPVSGTTVSGSKVSQQAPSSSSFRQAILHKSASFWIKATAISATTIATTITAIVLLVNNSNPTTDSTKFTQDTPSIVVEAVDTLSNSDHQSAIQASNHEQKSTKISSNEEEQSDKSINNQNVSNISPSSQPDFVQPTTPVLHAAVLPTNSTPKVNVVENKITTPSEDPVLQNATMPELPVSMPIKIDIPNVITPNGDGYNDHFVIVGIENLDNSRLTIWNNQKKIVFSTKNYNNNWGDDADQGTYTYQLEYSINGIPEIKRGNLTVMR